MHFFAQVDSHKSLQLGQKCKQNPCSV